MSYPKKPSRKPSIPSDAWDEIEMALSACNDPDPERPWAHLVAEQERLRVINLLKHRLNVVGVRLNDKGG